MPQNKEKWIKNILSNCSVLEKGEQVNGDLLSEKGLFPFINGGIEPSGYYDKYNRLAGTITISEGGNSCGYVNYMNVPFWSGGHCYTLKNIKNINIEYLYHFLKFQEHNIMKLRLGSGLPNIQRKDIENFYITYIENDKKQVKIATILSTCDNIIEKTEETIKKYKQIKLGMMQNLFTRGLDKDGKLRPTYQQSPTIYKYSEELDRYIPKDWEVCPLETYTTLIKDGTHGTHKDVSNGIPLLSAKDIQNGEIIIPHNCRTISKADYNSIHRSYNIDINDVLLTIVGTIGRVAVVKKIEKLFTFQRSVAIIKLINPKISNYMYYYLSYENTQRQLLMMMNASAQGGLYLGQLANIIVTMPKNKDEVNYISNYLNKVDLKIKTEEQYLNKYKHIKQGLMKQLLTPSKNAQIIEED